MRRDSGRIFAAGMVGALGLPMMVLVGCRTPAPQSGTRDIVGEEKSFDVRVLSVSEALNKQIVSAFGRRLCFGLVSAVGKQKEHLVWTAEPNASCGSSWVKASGLKLTSNSNPERTQTGSWLDVNYEGVGVVGTVTSEIDKGTTTLTAFCNEHWGSVCDLVMVQGQLQIKAKANGDNLRWQLDQRLNAGETVIVEGALTELYRGTGVGSGTIAIKDFARPLQFAVFSDLKADPNCGATSYRFKSVDNPDLAGLKKVPVKVTLRSKPCDLGNGEQPSALTFAASIEEM